MQNNNKGVEDDKHVTERSHHTSTLHISKDKVNLYSINFTSYSSVATNSNHDATSFTVHKKTKLFLCSLQLISSYSLRKSQIVSPGTHLRWHRSTALKYAPTFHVTIPCAVNPVTSWHTTLTSHVTPPIFCSWCFLCELSTS